MDIKEKLENGYVLKIANDLHIYIDGLLIDVKTGQHFGIGLYREKLKHSFNDKLDVKAVAENLYNAYQNKWLWETPNLEFDIKDKKYIDAITHMILQCCCDNKEQMCYTHWNSAYESAFEALGIDEPFVPKKIITAIRERYGLDVW